MVSSWTLLLQKIPWYEWDYMLFSPLDTQPHWTKNIQCFESLQLLDTEIFQVKLFFSKLKMPEIESRFWLTSSPTGRSTSLMPPSDTGFLTFLAASSCSFFWRSSFHDPCLSLLFQATCQQVSALIFFLCFLQHTAVQNLRPKVCWFPNQT